ncbi:MAG: hypothetical protein ABIQ17_00635, partial [Candidatus Limnocylindrales bacterium]
ERATEVLTTHRARLEALAQKLIAEETVGSEAFETLFSDLPPKERLHGLPPRKHGSSDPEGPADRPSAPEAPPASAPAPNPA